MQCGLLAIRFVYQNSVAGLPMYFRFGYYYESFIHEKINDFVLHVATVNGNGSMNANNILVKALFRMGIPVSGKKSISSNIQGLPTWFTIRTNSMGFTSCHPNYDVVVAMNIATLKQDIGSLPAGELSYTTKILLLIQFLRSDTKNWGIPFKDLVSNLSQSPKLKSF